MLNVLVIGNGESRKQVNLNKLKSNYTLIGCNAIHRDLAVEHLVCCDRRMVDEAIENTNNVNTLIYVRDSWYHYFRKILKNKKIQRLPKVPTTGNLKKDQPDHWGSGTYAILLAAELGFEEISLIGFDLYHINNKVNNVYKGTQNYSKIDSAPIDPSYWIYQTAEVFKNHLNKNFIVYNQADWLVPNDWKIPNVQIRNIAELEVDSINSSVVK